MSESRFHYIEHRSPIVDVEEFRHRQFASVSRMAFGAGVFVVGVGALWWLWSAETWGLLTMAEATAWLTAGFVCVTWGFTYTWGHFMIIRAGVPERVRIEEREEVPDESYADGDASDQLMFNETRPGHAVMRKVKGVAVEGLYIVPKYVSVLYGLRNHDKVTRDPFMSQGMTSEDYKRFRAALIRAGYFEDRGRATYWTDDGKEWIERVSAPPTPAG